jgi:hypothetical protein
MNTGELKNAERRALNILDKWIEATGQIGIGGGYYWELQGIIEDAVACGVQAALGVKEKLDSEK